MEEENQQQVQQKPQQAQQVMKEPHRVTIKDPKKVEAGKRLAAINCKKREAKKREEQVQLEKIGVNQYYGIKAVIALGVIGGLGYCIYQTKKREASREVKDVSMPHNPPKPRPQTNKFEMD